ncbi:hypothetical protein L13192_12622, partial [Pyrenophora tritici-repentis]
EFSQIIQAYRLTEYGQMSKIMRSRPIDRSYKSAINILHSRRRRPDRPSIKPGSNPPGLSRIPDAQGTPT